MILLLHNYENVSVYYALKKAGYRPHPSKPKEWIRDDGTTGRFHAKILDFKSASLHYDLFVDGKHVAGFDLPIKHNMERGRILGRIRHLKKSEMTSEKFYQITKKLADKHRDRL